jgi:putative transposase
LRRELSSQHVQLKGAGETARLFNFKPVMQRFLQACREQGILQSDYPFNQKDKGVRTLARTLRAWLHERFDDAAHAAGARFKPSSALRHLPERGADEAFDTVEFDAHKMDLRLKVIDIDPLGIERTYETERVWLLAIIDVATRCILGYTLSLQRECSRYDVIATIRHALTPSEAPRITLPGLSLSGSGGFVSQALPVTRHACWRHLRLDNARAHLATTSLDVVCEALGCVADFGPAYEPDDRPFIERFFGTLTNTLSRRLPGGLPSKTATTSSRMRKAAKDLRLVVTARELEELLDATVWNYHGTPHSGLGGLTPLERLSQQVTGVGLPPIRLRRVPEALRKNLELLHDPALCLVHGNVGRGERPYISFMHVRYTSEQLARRSNLIGKQLRVYFDAKDLRTLRAFTHDGQPLHDLLASGPWRHEAHSLRLRQEVFKAKRDKQLAFAVGESPIDAFVRLRRSQAPKSRRAASDLARIQRERRDAPSHAPASVEPSSQLVSGVVKGKSLRITRGFSR